MRIDGDRYLHNAARHFRSIINRRNKHPLDSPTWERYNSQAMQVMFAGVKTSLEIEKFNSILSKLRERQ